MWNVKIIIKPGISRPHTGLIDTLWNVKLNQEDGARNPEPRFNRYIVECKAAHEQTVALTDYGLIDTLWNVKQKYQEMLQKAEQV